MADKIVAEYTVKVDKAIKDLEKLAKKVDKVDDERKKTQDGFKSMSSQISGGFKQLGGVIAGAFATQQLVSFGKEAVKVAAQAEGIQRAFERLNRPNLLNELRKATRGTVDDLTLMRQAVRAENFKVPLENLGKFFDFATQRSIQTGESVDYLVNSIIDGIGRKSTLVLDNLGISASELQEEMKKVGDFGEAAGNIIARELEKSGDVADTTAVKLAKINAALDNMKVVAGEALINLGTGLLYLLGQVDTGIESTDGLAKAAENLASIYNDDVSGAVDKMIQKNQELLANQIKIAELEETRSYQNSRESIKNINEQIDKLEERNIFLKEYVTQLKAIYDASIKQNEEQEKSVISINSLNAELKEYQKDLKNAEVGSSEFFAILDKVTAKTKELNDAIALTKLEDALKVDVEEDEGQDGFIKAQLDFLEKKFPEATKGSVDYADELWQQHFQKKMEMNEEEYQQWLELQRKKQQEQELETQRINAAFEATSQIFSSFVAIQGAAREQELRGLEEQLNQGLIAREEYELKRKQILQQQAEDEKAAAIFEATVNGALAVVNAYNTDSTGILAGIVGAIVAAQIAAIAAQPVPQYEQGGFVDSKGYISGRSHKTGGVLIEAEGGEYITSKKYAQRNKDILEAINSGNWEKYKFENIISPAIEQVLEGGMDNIGASIVLQNKFNDKNMLRAFDRNRSAARQDAQYIVNELSKNFKGRLRGGFA